MMGVDGAVHGFVVERNPDTPGVSFSADAMDQLLQHVAAWIGTRVMRRWDATGEPPTALRVVVDVVAQ